MSKWPCLNIDDKYVVFAPILEESTGDFTRMINNSEVSGIEHMFKELSEYEDKLIDSDYEEYITGIIKNQ